LAVEYDEKDTCISKLAKGKKKKLNTRMSIILAVSTGHIALKGKEFWTSGTDQGCDGKNYWCSKKRAIQNRNMSWSSTSDGDCVSIEFTNGSQYSKTECSRNFNFICEVFKTKYILHCRFSTSIFRFIRAELMGRPFKMSAWKCGTFQLVRILN
jgi:hypothetical protein